MSCRCPRLNPKMSLILYVCVADPVFNISLDSRFQNMARSDIQELKSKSDLCVKIRILTL